MTPRSVRYARCYFCHERCGVEVTVEDGRAVEIRGDKESLTGGHICIKGRAAIEHLYHEDRVKHALTRVGERGENRWRRLPWDEAVGEIAERLQKIKDRYGPEAVVLSEGTDRTEVQYAMLAFLFSFGSPNFLCDGNICYLNDMTLDHATYGHLPGHVWSMTGQGVVVGTTRCIVLCGYNPSQSYPVVYRDILAHKKAGTKLIVVDPRRTPIATQADIFLQLRPATDGALALGWLNVVINEGLYDKDFVDKWCYGFDELKERVQEYPPARVAQITGLDEQLIVDSARMYAQNGPAMMYYGVACDQLGRNTSQQIRAKSILRAITGNLDVEGGELLGFPAEQGKVVATSELDCSDKLPPGQRAKQLGSDRFKLESFPGWELMSEPYQRVYKHRLPAYAFAHANSMYVWDAILTGKPYPVKAFFAVANNTLLSRANTKRVYAALNALDLLVVADYWMTPTAELADYVMPPAVWLERPTFGDMRSAEIGSILLASRAVVSPLGDCHTDYDFFRALALKLDLPRYFPWEKTFEELCDYRLAPLGLTFADLVERKMLEFPRQFKQYESTGFATPTGKVELYSTVFEKLGYDPLPFYEEPAESPIRTPELLAEYPLILVTSPRHIQTFHSEHRQIRSLRSKHPFPLVEVHRKVAQDLNISEGEWVYVETRRGRIRMKAKITDTILENVVMTEHSWWFPEEPAEKPFLHGVWLSNPNLLTDDSLENSDQLCGSWTNRGLLCRVYPVPSYVIDPLERSDAATGAAQD